MQQNNDLRRINFFFMYKGGKKCCQQSRQSHILNVNLFFLMSAFINRNLVSEIIDMTGTILTPTCDNSVQPRNWCGALSTPQDSQITHPTRLALTHPERLAAYPPHKTRSLPTPKDSQLTHSTRLAAYPLRKTRSLPRGRKMEKNVKA